MLYFRTVSEQRRSKKSPVPVLAGAPSLATLERFVQLLNMEDYWSASWIESRKKIGGDYRPIQRELRRLVGAWFRSGPDVRALLNADPKLDEETRKFRPFFIPTRGATARLAYLAVQEYSPQAKPVEVALGLFLPFLLNPYNEKLGGPCKHCGNYFAKKTERKISVYCSEKCGHRLTSRLANKHRRERGHERKLERANRWILRWCNTKTAIPWKEWVSNQAQIKKHWLTMAVRNGELVEPAKQI